MATTRPETISPHRIQRALLRVRDALAEASTASDPRAKNEAILWEGIAQTLRSLKLPTAFDTLHYARHLAPVMSMTHTLDIELVGWIPDAVREMRPDSQRVLGLWADAIDGMPNVADPALPVDVLYTYCLRVVGLGLLGAHAQAIRGNLALNAVTPEGRRCIGRRPPLADCVKHGIEPHRYNRQVLASFIILANCLGAGVSPDDDRKEAPPLPLDGSDAEKEDGDGKKHTRVDDDSPRQLGKRARIGGTRRATDANATCTKSSPSIRTKNCDVPASTTT